MEEGNHIRMGMGKKNDIGFFISEQVVDALLYLLAGCRLHAA